MSVFFSSDYHLSHANIMSFSHRPFRDISEMNETIISNHNKMVKETDEFYFLGDFTWDVKSALDFWNRLNGRKTFIRGNHDDKVLKVLGIPYYDIFELYVNKIPYTLCHYPMLSWNRSHFDAPLLFGHVHGGKLPTQGKMIDVGVDANNYFPVSLEEINKRLSQLPHNWNYIERKE